MKAIIKLPLQYPAAHPRASISASTSSLTLLHVWEWLNKYTWLTYLEDLTANHLQCPSQQLWL